ncbi:MAG: Glycosyl transferase, family 2 [Methanoculleus marisnigri]|uniref:Glycosyl transferase, family 2 n=1 Tax=Methanoculleus marisnigri TaxID=2198 RepID=A0A101IX81_9EURY|nr:MAG: Glycosyl transferase, family 2 [Methanoculleus marisnigri]
MEETDLFRGGDAEKEDTSAMISVVIPNYNGRRYLDRCLSSLSAQTFKDFEVILVDNGSDDGSSEYVERAFPEVRVVRNKKNLGFAGGVNTGIRLAGGEYILTLNNDTIADRDLLRSFAEAMDSDERVGMCASKMLFCDGRINSTGICLSRSGAAWDRGMGEDAGKYEEADEVFGPSAGAALYRMGMLDEIGLFDEDFFMYMEDVDLAFRGRLAGWRCLYVPNARVHHVHGGTSGFGSDPSVYYGNRNILWYPIKNFPTWLLISSLPWIVGRNLAVVPYYAIRGQGRTILRSKVDGLRGIPLMLKKRKTVVRRVSDGEIRKHIRRWSEIKEP